MNGIPSLSLQALQSKLDILCLPTDKLLLCFFSELAQAQVKDVQHRKEDLGTLLVSVGYLKSKAVVEVDIIQGNKLPGLDKTGELRQSSLRLPYTLIHSFSNTTKV